MIHFPSTLKHTSSTALPRRSDSLNATQQKNPSHKIFLIIEEELHDARRVHSHGQEEDLKLALNMLIDRLSEISSMLSEAYKTQADLEVQLNVAKSNLQLVISNNEMLEEALKRDNSRNARDVGWRRASAREGDRHASEERRSTSGEYTPTLDSGTNSPAIPSNTPQESSRFFKFRFTGSSPNPAAGSRPSTPHDARSPGVPHAHHLSSPSLPVLPSYPNKELEEITAELEKERSAKKAIAAEKEALEAELESLSQALFEEANKMVATERIKRADTEEELKEVRLEKEALRSALRLLEGENEHLRGSSNDASPIIPSTAPQQSPSSSSSPTAHLRRTSSQLALKSAPGSPISSPSRPRVPSLSLSPGSHTTTEPAEDDPNTQITPQRRVRSRPPSLNLYEHDISPWADVLPISRDDATPVSSLRPRSGSLPPVSAKSELGDDGPSPFAAAI